MKKTLLYLALISLPALCTAADNPTVVLGAEAYDQQACIQQYTNECIDNVCLTSEERDCSDECASSAEDKCPANNQ